MANEKDLKDYIHAMLVPPRFRPETNDEIEETLDMFEDGALDDEVVARILKKSDGTLPLSAENVVAAPMVSLEETAESKELLALHRSEGETESEDVKDKLEKYRQEAREQDDSDDDSSVDGDGLEG